MKIPLEAQHYDITYVEYTTLPPLMIHSIIMKTILTKIVKIAITISYSD